MKPRALVFPIGPSIAYVPLTKKKFALIDAVDAAQIGRNNWYAFHHKKQNKFYACTKIVVEGIHKSTGMQRVLLGLKPGDKLNGDHKNHNTLDYRRTNLRIATYSENGSNKMILPGNRSGIPCLHQLRNTNSWRVTIKRNNKVVAQKQFANYDLALAYWKEAYPAHSGEFFCPQIPALEASHA